MNGTEFVLIYITKNSLKIND